MALTIQIFVGKVIAFNMLSRFVIAFLMFHCSNTLVAAAAAAKLLQLCLTLSDSVDSSPPGSSVPGILQARTLGWVAISFSNA